MESQSQIDEIYGGSSRDGGRSSTHGWDMELEVSCHDELMSNFFAQPDVLAIGKTLNDLIQEGVEGEGDACLCYSSLTVSFSMMISVDYQQCQSSGRELSCC